MIAVRYLYNVITKVIKCDSINLPLGIENIKTIEVDVIEQVSCRRVNVVSLLLRLSRLHNVMRSCQVALPIYYLETHGWVLNDCETTIQCAATSIITVLFHVSNQAVIESHEVYKVGIP